MEGTLALAAGGHADAQGTRTWAGGFAGRSILVLHEQLLVAEGIARRAESMLGARCHVCRSLGEAIAAIARDLPDLIVCSDSTEPLQPLQTITARLRAAGAAAPLLVLARTGSAHSADEALLAGAAGYLPLVAAAEHVAPTIAAMLEGRSMLPDRDELPRGPRLTRREHEVLRLFSLGHSVKQVAPKLEMAESTVKTHARSIFRKLDVNSRTAALHRARELGLL